MKRTMMTVDEYLSFMKKFEHAAKRHKRIIILKTRKIW